MRNVLSVRLSPQKLAKIDRRAAEVGRDRSGYVRSLIEDDLRLARKPAKHTFASADLLGAYNTGLRVADNATVRRIVRQRLLNRRAKDR